MSKLSLTCLVVLASVGCDDPPTAPQVPSDEVVREHLEDIVVKSLENVTYATLSSDRESPTMGYALQLPGVDEGALGALKSFPTLPVGTHAPFCDSQVEPPTDDPFWKGRDLCRRLGKVSDTEFRVEVYVTVQPITTPDDGHELTYEGTDPAGTYTFDPNPVMTWSFDFSDPAVAVVTAERQEHRLTYRDADGGSVDLSHSLALTGALHEVEGARVSAELEFAPDPLCSEPISVTVEDDGDLVEGEIRCGSSLLASVGHDEQDFVFDWR